MQVSLGDGIFAVHHQTFRLPDNSIQLNSKVEAHCIHRFQSDISGIDMPQRFTFPFYYEPHPLSRIAVAELQDHLKTQTVWEHNFGIDPSKPGRGIGKMFGILVVQDLNGDLGYLSAFSGKLADANDHEGFVPPIYDMLKPEGFFNQGMKVLTPINTEFELLKRDPQLVQAQERYDQLKAEIDEILKEEKQLLKFNKKSRKARRAETEHNLSDTELKLFKEELSRQSLEGRRNYKALEKFWEIKLFYVELELNKFLDRLNELKLQRKEMSIGLQQRLFDQYDFLNQAGETKNVLEIFKNTPVGVPPSGAGECAAPKLFQYAFQHDLKPIAMAEFWWGKSPKSEIRKHGNFYPSCRGKCEPILAHMLEGIDMDDNPMLINPAIGKKVEIVYEDDDIAIVNKPAEMLSVPGKNIEDSVWLRMKQRYPDATGPLTVHRLDMSTSGILVVAKSQEVHKILQRQFIERTIRKRYIALLDGQLPQDNGGIDLPLRTDINDRPRQLVCYDNGKPAETRYQVIKRSEKGTRIYFYPITGRTHQLRVHAAHPSGLDSPIVGDDLYGQKGDRLHLHAEWIQIKHPSSKKMMEFHVAAPF